MDMSVVGSGEISAWANGFSNLTINTPFISGDTLVVLIMSNGVFTSPTNGWTQVGPTTVNTLTLFYQKMTTSGSSFPLTTFSGSGKVSFINIRGANAVAATGNYNGNAQTIAAPGGLFVVTTTGTSDNAQYTGLGYTKLNTASWPNTDYYTMAWKVIAGSFTTPYHSIWGNNENYITFAADSGGDLFSQLVVEEPLTAQVPSRLTVATSSSTRNVQNEAAATVFAWHSRSGDLAGAVDVRTLGSTDIGGTALVRTLPEFKATGWVQVFGDEVGELSSNLVVKYPGESYLTSHLNVLHNQATGVANIWVTGGSSLSATLDVKWCEKSDLPSVVRVPVKNIADAIVGITGTGDSALYSKIMVRFSSSDSLRMNLRVKSNYVYDTISKRYGHYLPAKLDVVGGGGGNLKSSIGIKLRSKLTGETEIVGQGGAEVPASINVFRSSSLPSSLGVAPINKMTGIVDVKQPDRYTGTASVIKDAYTRSGVPKLNYGADQVIVAGASTVGEMFQSFLTFEVDEFVNLPIEYVVEKVTVRLKFSRGRTPFIPLSLHEVTEQWTEYGITWANKPAIESPVLNEDSRYNVDIAADHIDFDITDFAMQAKAQGRTTLDLCLKTLNENDALVQFFSKEMGGSYLPQIVYTYYDYVIKSAGRSGLDSKVAVRYRGNRDLNSALKVKGYDQASNLPMKLLVRLPAQRPGTISVSRPELGGTVRVRQHENADLISKIAVQVKSFNDLEGNTLQVSRPLMQSKFVIPNRKDLSSKLRLRTWGDDNLFSWGIIHAPSRPGSIYVTPYIDLQGRMNVRKEGYSEIPSVMQLSEGNKVGSLFVLYREDITGSITVRGEEVSEVVSAITVTRPNLYSRIKVNPYADMRMAIRVQRSSRTELLGRASVTIPNLPSSVYIRSRVDLTSNLSIRLSGGTEISGAIQTSMPALWSTIQPRIIKDWAAAVTVRQATNQDLTGTAYVLNRKEIPSSLTVEFADRLPSSIIILSGWLKSSIAVPANALNDLRLKLVVRKKNASDIASIVDVWQKAILTSALTVRKANASDVNSTVIIKRKGNSDLSSKVDVWITRNLPSKIVTRRSSSTEIHGKAEVLSNSGILARIDIPFRSTLASSVNVTYRGKADIGSVIVLRVKSSSDLETNLQVIYGRRGDIPSTLGIYPTNKMTGILDIVEPLRYSTILNPVKDAYVRQDVPTLNYGKDESMAAGTYNGSMLRSLIGFDIMSIPKDHVINKAELKLFYSAGRTPKKSLEVNQVVGAWTETGVTWDNQPQQGELINQSYTLDSTDSSITFDVTDYVEGKFAGRLDLVDFILRAVAELEVNYDYFFTRETKYAPQLVVNHYDPIIRSFGRSNLDSMLTVIQHRSLSSKIRVRVTGAANELLSSIRVTREQFIEGSITVSKPALPSLLAVARRLGSEASSSLIVRESRAANLPGKLTVSQVYLGGKIYVLNRKDLTSKVVVKGAEHSDLFSWGFVSRPQTQAKIYVANRSNLFGRLTVRTANQSGLPAEVVVNSPKIWGSLTVARHEVAHLASQITVRVKSQSEVLGQVIVTVADVKNLPSRLIVTARQRPSAIEVRVVSDTDLPATISIPFSDYSDLAGEIKVTRPDTPATLVVPERSDLPSSILPNVWGRGDLKGVIGVSRKELPATLVVKLPFDTVGTLTVRTWGYGNLEGALNVSRPDMQSSIQVRETDDLLSSLVVTYPAEDFMDSWIEVLERNNMKGTLDVYQLNALPGRIVIISGNLGGSIAVRKVGQADWPSVLGIKVNYAYNLTSSLEVIRDWSYINSVIKIPVSNEAEGTVTIISYDDTDLPGTIHPRLRSEIPSRLSIRMRNKMEGEIEFTPVGDSELPGTLHVSPASNLGGKLVVLQSVNYDVQSKVMVIGVGREELPSSINIVTRGNADLRSTLGVAPYNRMTGKINIISAGDSELPGNISVTIFKQLSSRIVVRQSGKKDLPSTINVKEFDELPSSLEVRVEGQSEISCTIYVKPYRDLSGTIEVITAYPYSYIM